MLNLIPVWQIEPVEGMRMCLLGKNTPMSRHSFKSVIYHDGKWLGLHSKREYKHPQYFAKTYISVASLLLETVYENTAGRQVR